MLYTVDHDHWSPGMQLSAAATRFGLYRTRREALERAEGRRLLSVAIRYDVERGQVSSTTPNLNDSLLGWSAPAIMGSSGGVTTLAAIPAVLIQVVGPARLRFHACHPGLANEAKAARSDDPGRASSIPFSSATHRLRCR